ncbi:MAG: hypothetical protein M3Z40_07005 [Bifidobacterium sp.]|nr:hypothetical protein [Bifidobacterium sp.]
MPIAVKPITRDVEIVTDLQLMSDIIDLSNRINAQDEPSNQDKERLAGLVRDLDRSTLVLTLRGLPSSPWNAIVIDHTQIKGDRAVKDLQGMVADAMPRMLVKARYKDGEELDLDGEDLDGLMGSLTDIQVADLIQTIQTLNTPIDALPKEVRDLIG